MFCLLCTENASTPTTSTQKAGPQCTVLGKQGSEQPIGGSSSSDQMDMSSTGQSVCGNTKENVVIGKDSTQTITGFNWRLILNSTILTFTFNKIYLKEVFAKYSTKNFYKENFKPRLSLTHSFLFKRPSELNIIGLNSPSVRNIVSV